MTTDEEQHDRDPEPARRSTERTETVWMVVRGALTLVALYGVQTQHEGLSVAAEALGVIGQVAVEVLRRRRP